MGVLYSGELKSILFRLSLRKMDKLMDKHSLLNVFVEYYDIEGGMVDSIYSELFVERSDFNSSQEIPIPLDKNLNRYDAALSIIESIELASNLKFLEANKKLQDRVKSIKNSPSGSTLYCRLLIEDLNDCIKGMQDLNTFQSGVHCAHAYANMYYMERSSGVELVRKKKLVEIDNSHYGYLTDSQIKGYHKIEEKGLFLLGKYSSNHL